MFYIFVIYKPCNIQHFDTPITGHKGCGMFYMNTKWIYIVNGIAVPFLYRK